MDSPPAATVVFAKKIEKTQKNYNNNRVPQLTKTNHQQ